MNFKENAVAVIALIIAIIGLFYPQISQTVQRLGGVTNYDEVDATAIKIGGTSGSRIGPIISSTCSLIATSYSVAATTTVAMDCAVTGVVSGDIVFAQFATTTPAAGGNSWVVAQASASSTSGFITLNVANWTGKTTMMPASVASSTQYLVIHPVTSVPGL